MLKRKMNAFNRELKKAKQHNITVGKDYLNEYLPGEFTVEFLNDVIRSEDDFYRWVDDGGVLDKAKDSSTFDVLVSPDGTRKSRFSKELQEENKEIMEAERARQVQNLGTELYEGDEVMDVSTMSETQKATLYADNDLLPDDVGERDRTVEDVDEATRARWETEDAMREVSRANVSAKFDEYYGVWTSAKSRHMGMPQGKVVADNLTWLYEHRPDVLEKMFNSGKDEMQVDYIYLTPSNKAWANIPHDERHENVVNYITSKFNEVYADYQANLNEERKKERARKRSERDERLEDAVEEQRERIKRIREIEKLRKKNGGFK